MATSTATPRAESYLYGRLRAVLPSLKIYENYSGLSDRHIRYIWQASPVTHYIGGAKASVTTFLVYIAQGTANGPVWSSTLQADADTLIDALDQGPPQTLNGRIIDGSQFVDEHNFAVFDTTTNKKTEHQLGGYFRVYSSLA